ncbi:MAG: VWA domain-containing protein [Dehalococcoidia bacterium]
MLKIFWKEKAQVLPIMALLTVVFIGLLGLAIDMGRLFVARTELSRALDSAALAGVVELPNMTNAQAKATTYLNKNLPDATASFPPPGDTYQIRVKGTRDLDMLFMGIFGFGAVEVSATAAAGYGVTPVDVAINVDATGSMHSGCTASETDTGGVCPIKEAKDAAKAFVTSLLGASGTGSGSTLIGTAAFRGCYNPPRNQAACISIASMVNNLSANSTALQAAIGNIYAIGGPGQPTGGSGTNPCLALKKANDIIFGPGQHTEANTLRFAVVLSDGDSVYNAGVANQSSPQSPDSPCRPSSPATSDGDLTGNCRSNTQTQEAKIDTLANNKATAMKAASVEIYVVALSVCGGLQPSGFCNTSIIGQTGSSFPDSLADHNLVKCMASSTPGTNDHLFETTSAAALPGIFNQIAQAIAFRLTE